MLLVQLVLLLLQLVVLLLQLLVLQQIPLQELLLVCSCCCDGLSLLLELLLQLEIVLN